VKPFLDWEAIRDQVPFRHPSQLYEGIGEGLVLGIVIFVVWWFTRRHPLRRGWYAALFLFGYSAVRITLEYVRQPDPQFGPIGNVFMDLTMGQSLSTLMLVGGVAILVLSRRRDPPIAPADGGGAASA
jgi:phosphatidylglycerol:prolipoprotein diacylglycerol transferase